MIVLGIDPGLKNTGWGVVEQRGSSLSCVAYGCIVTETRMPVAERLSEIHRSIVSVISRYRPTACGIENVYFSTNAKTAFATGQARGVALLAVAGLQRALARVHRLQLDARQRVDAFVAVQQLPQLAGRGDLAGR